MAKQKRPTRLSFPVGGISLRGAAGEQPSGTTPWAFNMLPEDPGTLRLRGGSRPGLTTTTFTPPVSVLADDLQTEGNVLITTEAAAGFASGNQPAGVTFGCLFRDRALLSGNPGDPAIYASRQGAYSDFLYQADVGDTGRAVVFQLAEAGEIGAVPTCLIPHKDQYVVGATASTLWVLSGDPALDGTLRNVHREVGIVGPTAWCKVVDDIIFLAANDIYRVHCSGANLQNLSKGRLPQQLRGLNTATATVSMGYDHDRRGVYLFVYDSGLSVQTHWFFDLNSYGENLSGGFWLIDYYTGMDPTAVYESAGQLILLGHDGTYRTIGGTTDGGQAIASHLLFGPFTLDEPQRYGHLKNIQAELGLGSGTVAWNVVTATSAEQAISNATAAINYYQAGNTTSAMAYVSAKGTWTAGRNHIAYPRVRDVWAVLWLYASAPWSFEEILFETAQSGRWK